MITEVNHIGFKVADADKSIAFYTELLGGKVVSEAMIPASNTRCIYLQLAGSMIEILHDIDGPAPKPGIDHICFCVDDLDKTYEEFTAAGYEFTTPPRVAGSGRGRVSFLNDPNGVRVELIQRKENFRIPAIEGTVKSIDHYSLLAEDLDAAEKFYTQMIELEPIAKINVESAKFELIVLGKGVDTVELLRQVPPPVGNLVNHFALRVDNVDETAAYLKANGVKIEEPRTSITGPHRVTFLEDPDGIRIELVDRKDLRELR